MKREFLKRNKVLEMATVAANWLDIGLPGRSVNARFGRSHPERLGPKGLVGEKIRHGPVEPDLAALDHAGAVADGGGERPVLLRQENRHALRASWP